MRGDSESRNQKRTWLRNVEWIFAVLLILIVSPLLLQLIGFFQWSPINCWHYDVDINSGRIRYTRYFAFICVRQKIEESALSRALEPRDYFSSKPNWQRVVTFSPRIHYSPHYIYHSAMNQIRELKLDWKVGDFTPAARKASAKHVLELWRSGLSDSDARAYLVALERISDTNSNSSKMDEKDLPTSP